MKIKKGAIKFLRELENNNNREWFKENKDRFDSYHEDAKIFYQAVRDELDKTDMIERHKVYRIYRDVRFSKDKTPYNPRLAGFYKRATARLRGGYFMTIEPGNSMVGGGFWGPNSADLKRIRKEFEFDDKPMRKILNNKKFKQTFGDMIGEGVKTAPRGFDAEHPAIDLIRKKQFYFMRPFSDAEVCQPDFLPEVVKTFKTLRPYFDYMSDVLTTNLDGESIL